MAAGSAEAVHAAVFEYDFHAEDVVDGDAVLERMKPAGVSRDVAADTAGALRGRIGRVMEIGVSGGIGECAIGHAGFDECTAIARVEFENTVHACEADLH